jgi:hypothetical protein
LCGVGEGWVDFAIQEMLGLLGLLKGQTGSLGNKV